MLNNFGIIVRRGFNMAKPPKSVPPPDARIVETLTLVALGELEVEDAAASLGLSSEELEALVTKNPTLANDADARAREIQTDPDRTLQTSQRGLAAIAATLAKRVQDQSHALSVAEMVTAGNLLEKIAGVSEKRKMEIKTEIDPVKTLHNGGREPLLICDDRPNPLTGEDRVAVYMITPDSPLWVDFSDPAFREPNFCWLEHYAPLSPTTGELLEDALKSLLASVGFRYLDSYGRLHGGHL